MPRIAVLATCSLNQWAMDFDGNLSRTRRSIELARARGARFRVGPELELTGYGCEDHFLEPDTTSHAWDAVAALLADPALTVGILVDVGAPALHRGVLYNCRILILNREVILVRPKLYLADDGNYREPRWFRAWPRDRPVESFALPSSVRAASASHTATAPIGPAIVQCDDGTAIACESCEELWTPDAPHIAYARAGVDVIANASASHHALRKLDERVDLLTSATRKAGGAYLYSNQIGCDGGRLYYDGSALVALNGRILAQGHQFMLHSEVDLVTAVVDLDDVTSYRVGGASRGVQAAETMPSAIRDSLLHRVLLPQGFSVCLPLPVSPRTIPTAPLPAVRICLPEEEIARGPACWLWDYLRRSGMTGFFLPLSGGADSSATAAIVGSMCAMLMKAIHDSTGDVVDKAQLLSSINHVTRTTNGRPFPVDQRDLAGRILHTMYMGNSVMSSAETRERAAVLAADIGAYHTSVDIGPMVDAAIGVFVSVLGERRRPVFRVHGGGNDENLALQNIQARSRMLLSYLFAQLLPWGIGKQGSLLVLGSANVDEGLRGYLTKYDCSAADINPIGGICKADLKLFLAWAARPVEEGGLGYSSLKRVVNAAPTAELEPITAAHSQTDEEDMGMTYDELTWYGRLRKLHRCGPLSMYRKLVGLWADRGLSPVDVGGKVKFFFRMYAINRHKMTTLTPSYHAENYSPEDHRFDLRQFLYNTGWTWQFREIDRAVAEDSTSGTDSTTATV
jgi:NAD+ synthase (glutamine-hydrolysing)